MVKAVIFDLDGTLLDTLQDLANAGNHTLSVLCLPCHQTQAYRKMVGGGIPALIQRMLPKQNQGIATSQLASTIFNNYYAKHMYDLTAPYPGIISLLTKLKEENIQLGVLSNKADIFVKDILEKYFKGFFNAGMGHLPEYEVKPNPASLFALLEKMQVSKDEVLYCGDSDVDMLTAKNANVKSCGVLWGFRDEAELLSSGANCLAASAEELYDLIVE